MLICWWHKRMISDCLDSNRELPEKLRRHLQGCASCRDFYDVSLRISRRLASETTVENAPPPFLFGRIVTSLNRSDPPAPRRNWRGVWPMGATALLLVLVCAWFIRFWPGADRGIGAGTSPSQSAWGQASLLSAASQLPTEDKLREWSRELDQPLETEWQSVLHDARTAINVLAQNFLPDDLIAGLMK